MNNTIPSLPVLPAAPSICVIAKDKHENEVMKAFGNNADRLNRTVKYLGKQGDAGWLVDVKWLIAYCEKADRTGSGHCPIRSKLIEILNREQMAILSPLDPVKYDGQDLIEELVELSKQIADLEEIDLSLFPTMTTTDKEDFNQHLLSLKDKLASLELKQQFANV